MRTALLAAVIDVLTERGEPTYIGDLMTALHERSVEIPGSGQQANVIAHISRDERIVRPQRGFYGLREWGLQTPEPRVVSRGVHAQHRKRKHDQRSARKRDEGRADLGHAGRLGWRDPRDQ